VTVVNVKPAGEFADPQTAEALARPRRLMMVVGRLAGRARPDVIAHGATVLMNRRPAISGAPEILTGSACEFDGRATGGDNLLGDSSRECSRSCP